MSANRSIDSAIFDDLPAAERKTTCARCPTHCYKSAMRAQIKVIMRYAGRRMLVRHPILALFHMLDAWRRPSEQIR